MIPPTYSRGSADACDPAGHSPQLDCLPLTCPSIAESAANFVVGTPAQVVLGPDAVFEPACGGAALSVSTSVVLPASVTIAPCAGDPTTICIDFDGAAPAAVWAGNIIVGNGVAPACTIPYTITIAVP